MAEHIDAIGVALLALVGSVMQWLLGRRKDRSAIALIDAQTLSTLIQATKLADDRANAAWSRCDSLESKLDACEARSDKCEERADRLEGELMLVKAKLTEAGT